jgi:hypothetical protein
MKIYKLSIILILCIPCLIISCNKDKDEPGPKVLNQTDAIIGTEGGTVEIDELEITIPENCFTEDYDLSIKVYDEEEAFTGTRITYIYQIENFPKYFEDSIQIKLKYSGSTSGNKYIAIGGLQIDGEDFSYSIEEATDSSGYLIYNMTVPLLSSLKNTDDEDLETIVKFLGTENHTKDKRNHFKLEYQEGNQPPMLDRLVDTLESVYNKYSQLGFNYTYLTQHDIKTPVSFSTYKNDNYCRRELNALGAVSLVINPDNLNDNDFPKLSVALGREFLEVLLSYDIYKKFEYDDKHSDIVSSANHMILVAYMIALSSYAEEQFIDPSQRSYYIPMEYQFKGNLFEMGLAPDYTTAESDEQNAEYARELAAFVKYIADRWGFKCAKDVIYDMINRNTNLIEAVEYIAYVESEEWLPEFYKDLILGKIYGTTGDFDKTSSIDESGHGTEVSFTNTYNKASCKLFRIGTKDLNVENNSIMNITSQESTLAFSLNRNNNIIEFLSEGTSFSVSDLKTLISENKDILLAVINTNYVLPGQSQLNVTAKIQTDNFLACKVVYLVISGITVKGDFTKWTNEDYCMGRTFADEPFHITSSLNITSISGTQVTAEKHVDDGYGTENAYITITFKDTNYDFINSFNYEETYDVPEETTPIHDEYECIAGHLEKTGEYSEDDDYSRTFETTSCEYFELIKWIESGHRKPCYEMTATGHDCIDPSISISIRTP